MPNPVKCLGHIKPEPCLPDPKKTQGDARDGQVGIPWNLVGESLTGVLEDNGLDVYKVLKINFSRHFKRMLRREIGR